MIFDLLVAGAGPAGCAASIRAAKSGLTVALAEAGAFPRDLPGEALDPGIETLLRKLGMAASISKAGFLRNPGWLRCCSGKRTFMPFSGPRGLRLGYQAWRAQFDSLLLARAASLGVRVLQPARVCGFKGGQRNGCARVNGEEVRFRHVVDASGSNSWLRKELQLPVKRVSPQLTARFGYLNGQAKLGAMPEFHEHECAWTWLAQVKSDVCQFVRLSLDASPLPGLPPPFDSLRARGADVTWRIVSECAGDGYFLCGDAAAVLDPAGPSGVVRAIASGIRAAELVAQVKRKSMKKTTAAMAYRKWYVTHFVEHARQLSRRYLAFERPPVWLDGIEQALLAIEATE
jgi:flavin-dependent dehydrogenase